MVFGFLFGNVQDSSAAWTVLNGGYLIPANYDNGDPQAGILPGSVYTPILYWQIDDDNEEDPCTFFYSVTFHFEGDGTFFRRRDISRVAIARTGYNQERDSYDPNNNTVIVEEIVFDQTDPALSDQTRFTVEFVFRNDFTGAPEPEQICFSPTFGPIATFWLLVATDTSLVDGANFHVYMTDLVACCPPPDGVPPETPPQSISSLQGPNYKIVCNDFIGDIIPVAEFVDTAFNNPTSFGAWAPMSPSILVGADTIAYFSSFGGSTNGTVSSNCLHSQW